MGYPQHYDVVRERQWWERKMKRYFEFVGADSDRGVSASAKFWEVWAEGTSLSVRFGKIGTNGQTTVKEFPDLSAAEQARDKAITQKIKKGYTEVSIND